MLPGLLIGFAGLFLVFAPLVVARGANRLRFTPDDAIATPTSYRAVGVALAVFGSLVAALGQS